MIALYIVAGLLAVVLIVLFIPIGVRVQYNKSLTVWAKIGFIGLKVYPEKADKKQKKEKKIKEKNQKQDKPEKKPQSDISTGIETVKTIALELKRFQKRLSIQRLEFRMLCAAEDAAKAAVQFGEVLAAIGMILPFLSGKFNMKKKIIWVDVDYCKTKPEIYFDTIVVVRIVHLTRAGVSILLKYIRKMPAKKQEVKYDVNTVQK